MPSLDLPKGIRVAQPAPGVGWMAGGLGAFFPRTTADGHLELLVSGRDAAGESRIGAMVFEWGDPPRLLHVSQPLLDRGEAGAFDMNGAGYPWLVEDGGAQRMFYVGWMRLGGDVPFRNQMGLAEREGDGGPFRRVSRASWFPATDAEPIGTGSCSVDRLPDGRWRMLYVNFVAWDRAEGGEISHRYNVRQAFSNDGVNFDRAGSTVAIELEGEEVAIGTPAPRHAGADQEVLFTARTDFYRLYSVPVAGDGEILRQRTRLTIPPGDWDGQMQGYPKVLRRDGIDWLFYCGDGYGRAGIGMVPLPERRLAER
ncbi:MAG: hypothetical protein JSS35_06035 [Proteobacteria bacterium]|nr:hypothetical protein [Pseudomonadota bacterium]